MRTVVERAAVYASGAWGVSSTASGVPAVYASRAPARARLPAGSEQLEDLVRSVRQQRFLRWRRRGDRLIEALLLAAGATFMVSHLLEWLLA